jgi:large repetitive protein
MIMNTFMQINRIEKMKLFLISLAFGVVSTTASFAQVPVEICNNGLDDDFDGFIDCYDGSCSSSAVCDGIFLGNDANCEVPPPQFPAFTMTRDYFTPETANHLARMVIGDIDRDGMPEFVTMNRYSRKIFVINGSNGTVKRELTVTWEPYWEVAIGNLDNDGCAELFFIGYQNLAGSGNDGVYLFSYDCNLNLLWTSAQRLPGDPINFGLADFDSDGLVELYAKDEIYDAKTGIRIIRSTAADYQRINGGPVAVDMGSALPAANNTNLELVIGLNIYSVNLSTRTLDAGSLNLLIGRNEYFIRNEYNATSIADYNLDGHLDVLASGSTNSHGANTTVFFWDVKNNAPPITFRDGNAAITATLAPPLNTVTNYAASDYGSNGWKNGTGRLNVADLDGDGKMNVSYVSGKYLYALKEDFKLLWRKVINEETSGYTGCTLFDFNGDGKAEIVYRDERFVYIIQGTDGSTYSQVNCSSRTNREYPIVADVDADGSTEICVTCAVNDVSNADFNNFVNNNSSLQLPGQIRVFKSAAEPWVPARRVWNQHGYFVVNVNDDLTIPRVMQKHQTIFSTGSCTQGPNRPLNKFLNQSPFLNSEGCPTYASPDLAFSIAPTVVPPTCPNLNFTVSFQITNLGDVGLTGSIPVSFYTRNPRRAGAVKLNTINIPLVNFRPNNLFDVVNATVTGNGSDSLYVVLNDAGTTVPTPISLPNTTFFECNYDNILGVRVIPNPVTITAIEVTPHQLCSSPANGAARAFVPVGAVQNTADYNFYWSIGAVAKPIASADFVGPIYSGILDGTYTVFARHKTANCGSAPAQVVVTSIGNIVPAVTVNVLHQTQCIPPNGRLEALVAGGNSGYTFEWFNNATSLGITTSVASGLIGDNYSVRVSKNGCSVTQTAIVEDNAPDPIVLPTATPVVNCQSPNTGSVSATVTVGGVLQPNASYSFAWYFYNNATSTRGSLLPAANGTGATRTALPAGFYQVVATNTSAQCSSPPVVVQITNQTVTPVVTITRLATQTSCDPANPNGRLQATVTLAGVPQNPADFTFEWFVGQNTLAANLHSTVSGTNGSIAERVRGGGQSYTVKATSAFQCFDTDDEVALESLISPVVTLSPTPNGVCNPALVVGPSAARGSVTATVTFAGNPVTDFTNYRFDWYNGTQAIGATRPETTSVLSALSSGFYTLVVTRTDIFCASTPRTAEVLNVTVIPAIATNVIGSTNCVPALANGQALVTSVDAAGTGSPYVFAWHTGNDTSTPVVGNAATLANRQGGVGAFFTVLVTNQSNGCQNTRTVEVPDSRVIPNLTLARTPNSICNASLTNPSVNFNGTATGTVTNPVGPIGGYTFEWHNGQLITDPVNGSSTNQNLINLNGGYYTTRATQTSTGCVSSPVTVEVLNNTLIPVIASSAIGSTNCVPALANGQALVTSVDAAGTGSPYVFAWHTGNDTSTPVVGNAATLANRQGGVGAFFTVLVTNQSNGCQNTRTVEVPDSRVIPNLTLARTPNSICNASLTNPSVNFNGTATGTVTNPVGPIGGYTFEWHNGQLITDPLNSSSTNQNLISLNGGYYTTTATHTATGCVSSPVTVQVINNSIIPVIASNAIGSTNCIVALANGQALVTDVDGAGIGSPYIFTWHTGVDTTTPVVGNAATLANRQGGVGAFFTVLVTNQSNGCQNTETVEVPDNQSIPLLTLSSTDNQNCTAPFNGTAFVNTIIYKTVLEPLAGYSFAWTHGATTSTASALNVGTYELTVTRIDVGCTSNPVQVDVDDDIYIPIINTAITDQTSCDVLNPNGILSASMDETSIAGSPTETAGYTYGWTNDGNPLTPGGPSAGTTPIINSLPGNVFYTLTVERTATRCTNTQSVFLPERILLPRLELTATDIVDCNTDGFVTARIFIDKNNDGDSNDPGDELTPAEILAGYTIAWFKGSNTSGTLLAQTGRVLNEFSPGVPLPAGNYTAIATNTFTNCKTSDVTVMVNAPSSLFDILPEINKNPSSCGIDEGVMTAKVEIGGVQQPFGDYTFQWFNGNPTNGLNVPTPSFYTNPQVQFTLPQLNVDKDNISGGPIIGISGSPQPPDLGFLTGPTLYGRPSGTYSVVATNDATGCKEFKSFYLPYLTEPVIILAEIKPDDCLGDNGAIEVDLTAPSPVNTYKLQIYPGNNPTLGVGFLEEIAAPVIAATGNLFDLLPSGNYTIVAQETFGNLCFSAPVLVNLIEALPPQINVLASGANSTCVDALTAGDGSLEIQVLTDVNDPFSAAYPLPALPTILQRGAAPFVTYSIGVVDASSVAVPGYPTGSTFVDGDTELISGLRGETYTITVTSSHGCSTTEIFNVPDAPRVADLSGDVVVLPALACDPSLEVNASIEIRNLAIIGAAEICGNGIDDDSDGFIDAADTECNDNLSDYTFDWFTNVTLTANVLSANGDNTATKGGEILSNVGAPLPVAHDVTAGSYWVRVTKTAPGAGFGCLSAPLKVDIDDQSVKPVGTLTPVANTACDTNFEGSVTALVTNFGSMPAVLNYFYDWTSPVASPIADAPSNGDGAGADDVFTGRSEGTYSLSFTNNSSGCIGFAQTTIIKNATPIVVTGANPVDQIICDPDGSITVGPNDILVGGAVDNNHNRFDFTWSRGNVATIVSAATQNNDVLNITDLATIGAGSYFVKVIKRPGLNPGSGCESAPFRVDILDVSIDPTVTLTPVASNTACDASSDGSIRVTVTNPGSVAAVNYNYTWTTPVASPIVNGLSNGDGVGADDNFVGLIDGLYSVSIENNTSGCTATAQNTITKLAVPIVVANATPINQLICDPDGSITVGPNDILVGGAVDNNHTRFDFTWSRGNVATIVAAATNNNDVLNIIDLPTIGAGSYFVKVKKLSGPAFSPGSGCESAPFRVDILDTSVDPTATLTPIASNSACDANSDGSIRVNVTNPGSVPALLNYTYTWTTPVASPIANGLSNGDGLLGDDNFGGLVDGTYSVLVENNSSGCTTTAQNVITKVAVPIVVANATPINQFLCDPDGSITVGPNDILVGGAVDNVHTRFDFTWSRGNVATIVSAATNNNDVLNIVDLPTIGAGSYFVKVRKLSGLVFSPGSGCESASFRVDILDRSIDPTAALTAVSFNTSCDANSDGSVRVTVNNPGSVPAVNYTYTWATPVASPIANGLSNGDGLLGDDNFGGLIDGVYSVLVENNSTGCTTTAQNTITKVAVPIVVANATPIDQMICNPDGSITVGPNDILVGGVVDNVHTNFNFTWSRGNVATIVSPATNNNDVLNIVDLPTIGAGSYFVKVRKLSGLGFSPGSGCESAPFKVDIVDRSRNPLVAFTSILANSSCAGGTSNGLIEATASEPVGPAGTYNFVWTFNGGALPVVTVQGGASPLSRLTNAGSGLYTVTATNTFTGCNFAQALHLPTNLSLSLPNIVDINAINPITCNPIGSAEVVALTIGGTSSFAKPADDLDTDYNYEWYRNSLTTGLIAGQTNSLLPNQLPGTYFVKVRVVATNCVSAEVETVIDDADIIYPVIEVQQTAPQVMCTLNVGSGVLSAEADGENDTNPNYTFTWFRTLDATGPSFASTSTVSNLVQGNYSVQVHDLATDCRASELFIVPENKNEFLPVLALSSNPLTRCINPVDGSVYARAVAYPISLFPAENYPFVYDYTADLYVGSPPANLNVPEFPNMSNDPNHPTLNENFWQPNLANGSYTVRLTDNNTGCVTIGSIAVDDKRVFPKPVVTTIAPVTNCDPTNPNGVANALVDGGFVGFEFTWYEGNAVAGTPVYTGSEFGSLKVTPQVYTVEAQILVTGCRGTVQATIANGTVPIPAPQIEKLSDITSCVFDNGALTVSVGGNTKDYIFNWYDGATETPPVDFVGENYDSLATGTYSVTATSKITGCKSPLVDEDIVEKKEFPEFIFEITNAACDLPTGFATVVFTSTTAIGAIEWTSGNQVVAVGPNLSEVMAGAYGIHITSELGCEAEADFVILSDIRPRNGISRNGDSQNDYFHIDCIDEFVNNNVKIFNRAGTLVYEADGYDNTSIYFDGLSNRGISLIGSNVPDGTYFYIVDKRNGSKPYAGYLEVVK